MSAYEYLDVCDAIRDDFLALIEDVPGLHKRLSVMGHTELVRWLREHMDETGVLISNPRQAEAFLESRTTRRDLLLYAASVHCNLARSLIELCQPLSCQLSGEGSVVVADMGIKAMRFFHRKVACWPWDGSHPFSVAG